MIGAKQLRKPTYDAIGHALNRVSDQRWLRVWLKSAVAATPSHGDLWGDREQLIRRLAPGKSFLDLGGMFDISGRVAFLAEAAGAERVVLFDALDPSEQFQSEHAICDGPQQLRTEEFADYLRQVEQAAALAGKAVRSELEA